MLNHKCLAYISIILIFCQTAYGQLGFSHEVGIIAGPVQFRSDFGARSDGETNFGNSGFGIGLVHYLNFSYHPDCNCYTTDNYFSDHFKIRNEISFNKTNLEHFGELVDPSKTSVLADQLRGHTGEANNFDIGTQIEFYPFSLREFQAFGHRIAPFVSLGIHYTAFTPKVKTTYANPDPDEVGNVLNPDNFYGLWEAGSVDASSGSAWSVVNSIGFRYKLDRVSDLMLDLRGQFYFNDDIDGLNHQLSSNKSNDWLVWLNVGYIYYLD